MSSFDYHREMTGAVMAAPSSKSGDLVWIMNEHHIEAYRRFQKEEMGCVPDVSECFGIPIEVGQPADGKPFELRLRKQEGAE